MTAPNAMKTQFYEREKNSLHWTNTIHNTITFLPKHPYTLSNTKQHNV